MYKEKVSTAGVENILDQMVDKFVVSTETPNNFIPSRFCQVCPDFHFFKGKFSEGVCLDFLYSNANQHKSRHTLCTDLRFEENTNVDTLKFLRVVLANNYNPLLSLTVQSNSCSSFGCTIKGCWF